MRLLIKTYRGLTKNRRYAQFLVLLSFLLTFGAVRAITHLQRAGLLPNQQGALHIHHLVPGIFLILLSGYIGISFWHNPKLRFVTAILFGIGAALTIDEFALWLFLKDVYWTKQGRDSIDAILIVATLFTLSFIISEAHDHKWLKRLQGKL